MKQSILTMAALIGLSGGAFAQTTPDAGGAGGTGTTAAQRTDDGGGHNYGWIGLLGLAGLAGLRSRGTSHSMNTSTGTTR